LQPECLVTRGTGASGQAPRGAEHGEILCGRRGASGHMQSDTSGHEGCSLDHDRTLALSHLVVAWSASGHVARVGGVRTCTSGLRSGVIAFDCRSAESTVEIERSVLNAEGHVDGVGRTDAVQRLWSVRPARPIVLKNRPVKR
jgi:hypothetical protein